MEGATKSMPTVRLNVYDYMYMITIIKSTNKVMD